MESAPLKVVVRDDGRLRASRAWSSCRAAPSKCVALARSTDPRRAQDITNDTNNRSASEAATALPAGKKPLKSDRKPDDVDMRDATNPQACTEYVNDMYVGTVSR